MARGLILKEFDKPQGRLTDGFQAVRADLVERVPLRVPVLSWPWWMTEVKLDEVSIDKIDGRDSRGGEAADGPRAARDWMFSSRSRSVQ